MAIRPRRARCCVPAVIVLCIAACGEAPVPGKSAPGDPWLRPPPAIDADIEPLPGRAFQPVATDRITEAEEFLAKISIAQLSPGEIDYFAGHHVELPDVSRPYLIRGAYRSAPRFTIAILGNALWVASADKPGESAPVKHQPLVLVMDEVPETVYVTTGREE